MSDTHIPPVVHEVCSLAASLVQFMDYIDAVHELHQASGQEPKLDGIEAERFRLSQELLKRDS
jgi:hypothetical protein